MTVDITIPTVGESIQEAVLAQWMKQNGDRVSKGDPVLVIETDKVTLEIPAEADGVLVILTEAGTTVRIGAVVGRIETEGQPAESPAAESSSPPEPPLRAPDTTFSSGISSEPSSSTNSPGESEPPSETESESDYLNGPSVRRLIREHGIDLKQLTGSGPGGRITRGDVLLHLENLPAPPPPPETPTEKPQDPAPSPESSVIRKPMTPIRKRIAERLLEARRNTAMLTTFNEIDMSRVLEIRKTYQEPFQQKHGVSLGIMSFFIQACVSALQLIPDINASVDGDDILYHQACHIGVAVGSGKGLVVPVIRNAETKSFAELEKAIADMVERVNTNRLNIAELEGGTFTISNGGVYGSLLSTPILNTPQSGILGMHKIEKRPVVIDDAVVIRPMMYVALSYDHRIVDGKGAVTFLKRVKECVEAPERMLVEV
jgi:2-oxoglutarate dehydrogenase E2 component (dihydrolipoamide succinyltransferase)